MQHANVRLGSFSRHLKIRLRVNEGFGWVGGRRGQNSVLYLNRAQSKDVWIAIS